MADHLTRDHWLEYQPHLIQQCHLALDRVTPQKNQVSTLSLAEKAAKLAQDILYLTTNNSSHVETQEILTQWQRWAITVNVITNLIQQIQTTAWQPATAVSTTLKKEIETSVINCCLRIIPDIVTIYEYQIKQQNTQSTQILNQIFRLTAGLARKQNLTDFWQEAVNGLARTLDLIDATIYTFDPRNTGWLVTATNAFNLETNIPPIREHRTLLRDLLSQTDVYTHSYRIDNQIYGLRLGVLLQVGSDILGALVAHAYSHNSKMGAVNLYMTTFASNLAPLWQNLQLYQQTNQLLETTRAYSTQWQLVTAVSQAANTILDIHELISTVLTMIRDQFDFYYVGLFTFDPQHDQQLQLQFGTGIAGQQLIKDNFHLSLDTPSMVTWVAQHNQERIENDVYAAEFYFPNPYLPETRSELTLPLRNNRGDIRYILTIQSNHPHTFPPHDVTVFRTMAENLATALNNATLFDQVTTNLTQTNQLYKASHQLNKASAANLIYQALIDYAAQSNLVDIAHIITADPQNRNRFIYPTIWSRDGQIISPHQDNFYFDAYPVMDLMLQNEIVRIQDGPHDDRLSPTTKQLFTANKMRSAVMIPIHTDNNWLATLTLNRRQPVLLTDKQIQPFVTLADQAATALANQQFLRQTNALYRLGRALINSNTSLEAIDLVLQEIISQTGLQSCRFFQFDPATTSWLALTTQTTSTTNHNISFVDPNLYQYFQEIAQPITFSATQYPPELTAYANYSQAQRAILFPAIQQKKLIGFLSIEDYSAQYPLSLSEQNFISSVLDQLTTTLDNLQLFDNTVRHAQELMTLNRVGTQIANILDLPQLARTLYHEMAEFFDMSGFIFGTFNHQTNWYQPILIINQDKAYTEDGRMLLPQDPLYQCLHSGQPLLTNDPTTIPASIMDIPHHTKNIQPQSILWIPMLRESQPLGIICLQSYHPHAYPEKALQILTTIATQIGLAVSNANLFQETQANVNDLRQLFHIAEATASSIHMDERLQNVLDALARSLHGAHVAIMTINNEKQILETQAQAGNAIPYTIPINAGLPGRAIRTGKPMLVSAADQLTSRFGAHANTQSQLVVPLNLGDKRIGIINAESPSPNAFTERDSRLLQTISSMLATTIESGRLLLKTQEANEQLRELDRLKTQFLSTMSHELRTPLNSIIGFSRVMLKGIDGPLTPMQEEDLNAINNSGHHLLNIINGILDLAKIEAGRMALSIEKVDIATMADELLPQCQQWAKDKPIEFIWDIEPNLPTIEADPMRLQQILSNLLNNAVKFTDKGHVHLQIYRKSTWQIHIKITDTGRGIAAKDHRRLFTAFQQATTKENIEIGGGTGLGLSIAQRLVHMHEGQIWFESQLGHGATFHVTLPLNGDKYKLDPTHLTTTDDTKIGYILIIDADPKIYDLYEEFLRHEPYHLIHANTGQQALEYIDKHHSKIEYILLDTNLPDMDGWLFLSTITNKIKSAAIPVIVCSHSGDINTTINHGGQMLLLKPIRQDDLINAIKATGRSPENSNS
ncbi:MAG TPA: GAF domain-containing protein [Anaerolineae bacterium]|nr:GAF domain-containing protein [Anaerolineae bacterium]